MVASEVEPSHLYGSARLWFFVLSFTRKKRRSRLMDRMTTNVNFPHSSSSFVGCTMGAKHCEKSNDLVEGATRLSKRRVFVLSSDLRALGGLRKSHEANNWILELFLTFFSQLRGKSSESSATLTHFTVFHRSQLRKRIRNRNYDFK